MTQLDGRLMRCPECRRVSSVPDWCRRPICVHSWQYTTPEIWDGDDVDGNGRPIENSPNAEWNRPGPNTWTAMIEMDLGELQASEWQVGYDAGQRR